MSTEKFNSDKQVKVSSIKFLSVNPSKHSVLGAATLTQNSQLLKCIPEISDEFFTFITFLQIAFTVLGTGLLFNSSRISQ